MPENRFVVRIACLTLALVAALPLLADEGLWPYNQFPADALKQKRDFTAPPGFLDQLRLSSVRIGNGSGAFVSSRGLLLTNRQMAAACLAAASSAGHDLAKDGFLAATSDRKSVV